MASTREDRIRRGVPAFLLLLVAAWAAPSGVRAAEDPGDGADLGGGRLLIVGGGLKADNAEIYGRLIALAGGPEQARIGILPTASGSLRSAEGFARRLEGFGLRSGAATVVPIVLSDAEQTARDPEIVRQIAACTGIYFTGGDQSRITRALLEPDGSDTPALGAIRGVLARGGVVAGSSAGAAIMGPTMYHARGAAFDTLDLGLGREPHHRGAFVEPGLGFFRAGPVDQHFHQRGRLARLARVLVERQIDLGFGIDEDTAIVAAPSGAFEVIGRGGVTVLDASDAEGGGSPLGFHARGLRLTYLERGDRFDPATRTCSVHPDKAPIRPAHRAEADEIGLIRDLGQGGAVRRALTAGLVECEAESRAGLFVRGRERSLAHGYRFTFVKTDATRGHFGQLDGRDSYTVCDVRLDVEPITGTLEPPESILPLDLDDAHEREAIEAVVFRGLMPCDEARAFHPVDPLTRAEFAEVLARVAGRSRRGSAPAIADVPPDAPTSRSVAAVVASGLMLLDDAGAFRPDAPITRREVAAALARARAVFAPAPPESDPDTPREVVRASLKADPDEPDPEADPDTTPATREEVAVAVARYLGLPW